MPNRRRTDLHRVVALVEAPLSTFELSCAAEVFGIERPGLEQAYSFEVCTQTPGPVATRAGYSIMVTRGLTALRTADTIVLPGWPVDMQPSPRLVRTLKQGHARGARIVAICSGTYLLAATGLLDGRTATTHWRMAADVAERFPLVDVQPDVLFIDHGDVATSAGTAAGIDLCLHLLRLDMGASYAADVARHMVMPIEREGGQLQYATVARPATGGALGPALEWAAGRLHEPIGPSQLAAKLRVSERTVARRFQEQLGTSPGRWLLRQRIIAARDLLESTDLTIEAIAGRVGLSTAANLRTRFQNELHTSPGAYRRAFRRR
jgi:AraC family transcriptional activator FtrA